MSLHSSGFVVMMVLIGGGLVSFWGPVIGALFFILARDLLGAYTETWLLWYGLLFMAMVLWQARGHRRHVAGVAAAARRPRAAPAAAGAACRRKEACAWRSSKRRACTSASATRSCCRTSRSSFEEGAAVRNHGTERRRQDDLLQRADRPLRARPRPRHASPAKTSPACRRARIARQGHLALVPGHEPVRRLHGARQRADRAAARAPARLRRLARPARRLGAAQDRRPRVLARVGLAGKERVAARRASPTASGARSRSASRSPPSRACCSSTSRRRASAPKARRGSPSSIGELKRHADDRRHRARHALPVRPRRHASRCIHWGQVIAARHAGRAARESVGAALEPRARWRVMLALDHIDTFYGETQVLFGVSLDGRRRRGGRAARPQRRRQDDDAALDPRPDAGAARQRPLRRRATSRARRRTRSRAAASAGCPTTGASSRR